MTDLIARLLLELLRPVGHALWAWRWSTLERRQRRLVARLLLRRRYRAGPIYAMPQQIANYVQSTLSAPMTNASTTATLVSVAGLPAAGPFRLIIKDAAPATTYEITEVASVNPGTGVVTFTTPFASGRGLEGTTAIAHSAGAFTSNDITAAMLLLAFPLGVLGKNTLTTDLGLVGGTLTDTGLSQAVTIGTLRNIKITAWVPFTSTVADGEFGIYIVDVTGAVTVIQAVANMVNIATVSETVMLVAYVTPAAGARTYKVQAQRINGTGTVTVKGTFTGGAYLVVEDVGSTT